MNQGRDQDVSGAAIPGGDPGHSLIRLGGVQKVFDNQVKALDRIDLEIGRAEFVSLLGPSGCGKSTLLRIISGLTGATGGGVHWNLEPAAGTDVPDIGYVFQQPTLMPWATVFDNVYLPLKLRGVSRRAAHEPVMAQLEALGLGDFASAFPRQLSGGMQMRASIARALVLQPPVLLLDEPFAALDEITRNRLNDDLLELWQGQNWTVVFVTHSVFESVYLSQRIVVLGPRPGRIVSEVIVPAPYPRGEVFRGSSAYLETASRVSGALHEAMAGQGT